MRRAGDAGLDPKLVERLWTTIITHACQIENAVGGIEGGELTFQGVSLDHARVEVDDLDAACARSAGGSRSSAWSRAATRDDPARRS